jgi:hypothetical protein
MQIRIAESNDSILKIGLECLIETVFERCCSIKFSVSTPEKYRCIYTQLKVDKNTIISTIILC